MDYINEIANCLNELAGKYGVYEIFSDWATMMAMCISNQVDILQEQNREQKYMDIAKRYSDTELKKFSKMMGLLTMATQEKMFDAMGAIYMSLGVAGKQLGQFFTPYHLCQTMADISLDKIDYTSGWLSVYEPSVGAGGNIIAYCEALHNAGVNYQEHIVVVCQDLDLKCVHMAYVQLSLYGIPAIVVQGNTLKEPWTVEQGFNEYTYITPMYMLNRYLFTKDKQILCKEGFNAGVN